MKNEFLHCLVIGAMLVCGGCRDDAGGETVSADERSSESSRLTASVVSPAQSLFERAAFDDTEALKALALFYRTRLQKTHKQEDLCLAACFHATLLYEKECEKGGGRMRVIEPWPDFLPWQDAQRLFDDYDTNRRFRLVKLEAPFQLRFAAAAVGAQNALIDLFDYYAARLEKTGSQEDFCLGLFFYVRLLLVSNGLEAAMHAPDAIRFYRQYAARDVFNPKFFRSLAEYGSYSGIPDASQELGELLLKGGEPCVYGLAICHLRYAASRGNLKAQKELDARKIPWKLASEDEWSDIETFLKEEGRWQPPAE